MSEIENFAQWTSYINKISTDLRSTANSVNDRNEQIRNGAPKASLARQHVQNQRSLRALQGKSKHFICAFLFVSPTPFRESEHS